MLQSITVNEETIQGEELESLWHYHQNLLPNADDEENTDLIINSLLYAQAFMKTGKAIPPKKISHWLETNAALFPEGIRPETLAQIAKRHTAATLYVKEMRRGIHPTDQQRKDFKARQIKRVKDGTIIFVRRIFERVEDNDIAEAMINLLNLKNECKTPEDFDEHYLLTYFENQEELRDNPYLSPTLVLARDLKDSLPKDMKEMLFALKPGELSDIYNDNGEWIWFAQLMPPEAAIEMLSGQYLEKDLFYYLEEKQADETLARLKERSTIIVK